MRILAALVTLLSLACTTVQTPPPPPPSQPEAPYGMSVEEEAVILRLEDRREFDRATFEQWAGHENALHRSRAALALGRIGQATFDDKDGDREKDGDELMAGVDLLQRLATDSDFAVRKTAAFALGEIGDSSAVETLFVLARDSEHADVAAEAVEALSKLAANVPVERFVALTAADVPAGVRARAIRFLFRFDKPEAAAAATALLESSDVVVRREAAYAQSRRPDAAAQRRLELLLVDSDTLTRAYAARAVGRLGSAASLDALFDALADIHPWVRTNAIQAIAQIADRNPEELARRRVATDAVRVMSLIDDADPGTRAVALEALGLYARISEVARTRLLEIAVKGSNWQRELAAATVAKNLAGIKDSPLSALAATDSRWVKTRILEGTTNHPSGVELRKKFAADSDPMVRANALGAIPEASLAAEAALVEQALSDPDPVVRASAVDRFAVLHAADPARIVTTLRAAEERGRSDRDLNDVRLSAIRAVAAIDFPERESWLRGFLSDSDPVVRRAAADLIVEKLSKLRPQFTPLPVERPLSEYEEIIRWSRERHTATVKSVRGDIQLVLLSQDAPLTTRNFADLARRGYFDNTSFMRVVPNFVVQSGDPRNDQNGGPGYSIRDEINQQKYTRGAVGMALSGPDTGGSQWFITHSPQPHLDGGYTIFARVVGGMNDVVDQIERGDVVRTIVIDEKRTDSSDVETMQRTPLPTQIGHFTAQKLVRDIPEYAERVASYTPAPEVVEMLASTITPADRIEVFLGTWCSDSLREVPKLLKVTEELRAKFGVEVPASFVAVNRGKNEPAALIATRGLEKVATIVVYRDNQELGRIVETPEGLFEDHLLRIFAKR